MTQQTILLLEDQPAISELLRLTLQRRGYTVLSAQTGPEAMRLARSSEIGLLLCDVVLQNESGAALATEIRKVHHDLRVLYLSGYPLDVLIESALLNPEVLQNSATSFLQKPFLPKVLVDAVERMLTPKPEAAADLTGVTGLVQHVNAAY